MAMAMAFAIGDDESEAPREVYIAPVVPVENQVVLPGRLLHTLLTPRTLVRSVQYLTSGIIIGDI